MENDIENPDFSSSEKLEEGISAERNEFLEEVSKRSGEQTKEMEKDIMERIRTPKGEPGSRDRAKSNRMILDDKFNEEEYVRGYDMMTEKAGKMMEEINNLLEKEEFGNAKRKIEMMGWEVENLMTSGKERIGAGVDFTKTEIFSCLDKLPEAEAMREKLRVLERLVGILERKKEEGKIEDSFNAEGINNFDMEVAKNCREGLDILEKMSETSMLKEVLARAEEGIKEKREAGE